MSITPLRRIAETCVYYAAHGPGRDQQQDRALNEILLDSNGIVVYNLTGWLEIQPVSFQKG